MDPSRVTRSCIVSEFVVLELVLSETVLVLDRLKKFHP